MKDRAAYIGKLNTMTLTELVNEYMMTGECLAETDTFETERGYKSTLFLIAGIGQFKFEHAWVAEVEKL